MPGAKVEVALMDLANLATIRDFANRALDIGKPLDILINNAGSVVFMFHIIVKCTGQTCVFCVKHLCVDQTL